MDLIVYYASWALLSSGAFLCAVGGLGICAYPIFTVANTQRASRTPWLCLRAHRPHVAERLFSQRCQAGDDFDISHPDQPGGDACHRASGQTKREQAQSRSRGG